MPNFDWDDNEAPLAYLITIRTYGTWLHGDERSSVDLRGQNIFGAPKVKPVKKLKKLMERNLADKPFILGAQHRGHVETAIKEVCKFRSYGLHAINVRTNHAHAVVSALAKPERIATEFKSYSTRRLREENVVDPGRRLWCRGESTRYLWKDRHVELAIDYVLHCQGEDLPKF
jgi:REP element-mobilizing transposase RayT